MPLGLPAAFFDSFGKLQHPQVVVVMNISIRNCLCTTCICYFFFRKWSCPLKQMCIFKRTNSEDLPQVDIIGVQINVPNFLICSANTLQTKSRHIRNITSPWFAHQNRSRRTVFCCFHSQFDICSKYDFCRADTRPHSAIYTDFSLSLVILRSNHAPVLRSILLNDNSKFCNCLPFRQHLNMFHKVGFPDV